MSSNLIKTIFPIPRPADQADMELLKGPDIAERFAGHLEDESRMIGQADLLAFPLCEADVLEIVLRKEALTVSSGRTGIVGGAVPPGGIALSTERMNALEVFDSKDGWIARCGPGVSLEDLAAELASHPQRLFFPPNPTETSAQIGGTVAANASGGRTFKWGPTRNYVQSLRLVLACGEVLEVTRGQCQAQQDGFRIELASGKIINVPLPNIKMPQIKSAAGYWSEANMDLIDLFIGSEGTLGIITEVQLAVKKLPESLLSLQGFFPSEKQAFDFVRALRGEVQAETPPPAGVQALEYFDGRSLALLRQKKVDDGPDSEIPDFPKTAEASVLLEITCSAAEEDDALETAAMLLEEFGADSEQAWAGLDDRERSKMTAFRHALPEAVNSQISLVRRQYPELTKVGTDMAVPAAGLDEMVETYHDLLGKAKLSYVIFGHLGENHLHVNVLPADMQEYARAKQLYLQLATKAVELGGTVSAEHGIGKLKKKFLEIMYGADGLEEMRSVKRALDPDALLGPGTLFDI
jgi:D-lactate dehydrogenase (cytochrome)